MSNIKNTFEKILNKFTSKKEHFKHVIDRWKAKNKTDDYTKAIKLFTEAEKYSLELPNDFIELKNKTLEISTVSKRVKDFKNIYKELNELTKSQIRQWCEAIIIALILAAILRNFLFGLYHVPSGSAEPQILIGDRIWGNKFIYFFTKPKVGEFVIFDNPACKYDTSNKINYLWQRYVGFSIPFLGLSAGPENIVKRVLAIPGDTIEGKIEDGHPVVYRNGVKVNEPYINKFPLICINRYKGLISTQNIGPFNIPSFLQYNINEQMHVVTYDPSKDFDKQLYYNINPEEIVRDKITGKPILLEPFTPTQDYTTGRCVDIFGPLKLEASQYWVVNDSRKNSYDSRFWGPLEEKYIHGRASFIIYSTDGGESCWLFELIKHPIDFWFKYIRWNRFFKGLGKYNNYINKK
jgi:signal peptidase I